MQTFLPYEDFLSSAACLDRQRLGKQRVECLQILRTLVGESKGWAQHPAVKMWRGHEVSLVDYAMCVCNEWTSRGYKDTCRDKILALGQKIPDLTSRRPSWLGWPSFHRSHQSNLLRKDPVHYSNYFKDVPDDLDYVWPA